MSRKIGHFSSIHDLTTHGLVRTAYLKIMKNDEKIIFFENCCWASWLCSYMSKITSGVVFDALGPTLKRLEQGCEIPYFDPWEHGIPENHGFHEKS